MSEWRTTEHARIDQRAEQAKDEIGLIAAIAQRKIRRMAEFPARSAGQIRRYQRQNNTQGEQTK